MKILSRVLFLLFILIGVLVAVSNTESVRLALWPLPHIIVMPVYLLVIAMLMLGVLAGLGMGWWVGRHHRRRARAAGGEAARLDREVARLKAAQAAQQPTPPAGIPARDQRALERQGTLVSPELGSRSVRGPFS